MSNLGWMFYKDYFSDLDYNNLDDPNNENIIQNKVQNIINQSIMIEEDEPLGNIRFKATTTYPGLILGSGNAHELPSIEGQAILGFHFDYTSGLPVIQGSSIKGVLRSAFDHVEYIEECLNKKVDVEAVEKEIFDNGDVFFDAIIISNGKILGDDYITPHGDDPLKNPKLLRFIKVLPNVTFRFDFELSDSILSSEEKGTLFKKILKDLGLGAKTNVGYGQFVNFKDIPKTDAEKEEEAKDRKEKEDKRLSKLSPIDRIFDEYNNDIPNIINDMKSKLIDEKYFIDLAKKIKVELQKNPKTWDNAKQKALKRKEYIESILNG